MTDVLQRVLRDFKVPPHERTDMMEHALLELERQGLELRTVHARANNCACAGWDVHVSAVEVESGISYTAYGASVAGALHELLFKRQHRIAWSKRHA